MPDEGGILTQILNLSMLTCMIPAPEHVYQERRHLTLQVPN